MLVQEITKIREVVQKMAVPVQTVGKAVSFFNGVRDVFSNLGSVINGNNTQPSAGNIFSNLFGGGQTPGSPSKRIPAM